MDARVINTARVTTSKFRCSAIFSVGRAIVLRPAGFVITEHKYVLWDVKFDSDK